MDTQAQPLSLLQSVLLHYEALAQEGVADGELLGALQAHLTDLLDVVKDYHLQTLDHFIVAASIAVNNVQDVRLYSLEARMEQLTNKEISVGELLCEVAVILMVEVGVIGLGTAALPAAVPATLGAVAGFLTYTLRINRRIGRVMRSHVPAQRALDATRSEALAVIQSLRSKREDHARASDMLLRTRFWETDQIIDDETRRLIGRSVSMLQDKNRRSHELESQISESIAGAKARFVSERDVAIERAKLLLQEESDQWRQSATRWVQQTYDGIKEHRGQDALSATLSAVRGSEVPSFSTTDMPARQHMTPSSAVTGFIATFQRMKIEVLNNTVYKKAALRGYRDAATLFEDAADILGELDDLYPRIVYIFDSVAYQTDDIAARFEVAVWWLYLRASGILSAVDARGRWVESTNGILFSQRLLPTQMDHSPEQPQGSGRIGRFQMHSGIDLVGLDKLTENQAHYLFRKYVVEDGAATDADPGGTAVVSARLIDALKRHDIDRDAVDRLMVPSLADAVDTPPRSLWGVDRQREERVRLLKLGVVIFFREFEAWLAQQDVRTDQFGEDFVGKPFQSLLDLLRPAEPNVEPPPESSPESGAPPPDAPLTEFLHEYVLESELTPDLLLMEAELLILRSTLLQDDDWQTPKLDLCTKIAEILYDKLGAVELTTEQAAKLRTLEDLYDRTCNRRLT